MHAQLNVSDHKVFLWFLTCHAFDLLSWATVLNQIKIKDWLECFWGLLQVAFWVNIMVILYIACCLDGLCSMKSPYKHVQHEVSIKVLYNNIIMYLLYSWRFSRYSASFHWLVHGHMTSNNETVSCQMPWAGQHCESYDVKRETVHCYPVNSSLLTAVARNGWNLSAVFKLCFCFVLLYNKSLNDWSLGKQWILFPLNLNVSLDFVSGNWNS